MANPHHDGAIGFRQISLGGVVFQSSAKAGPDNRPSRPGPRYCGNQNWLVGLGVFRFLLGVPWPAGRTPTDFHRGSQMGTRSPLTSLSRNIPTNTANKAASTPTPASLRRHGMRENATNHRKISTPLARTSAPVCMILIWRSSSTFLQITIQITRSSNTMSANGQRRGGRGGAAWVESTMALS